MLFFSSLIVVAAGALVGTRDPIIGLATSLGLFGICFTIDVAANHIITAIKQQQK